MKDCINYLKLDLRISKKSILMIMPVLIFMAYMFLEQQVYIMGISYLFLIKIVFVNTPFMTQANEGLSQLHYIFPTKISKMVLGRFMYLTMWYLVTLFIEVIMIMYLYNINEINNKEIIIMGISEIIVSIILFIQYPVSYKIGFENSKILLNIICTLPGIIMMSLPTTLIRNTFLGDKLDSILNFVVNNENILITVSIFILIILGYISYLVSCRICKRKEV
jgi:hypothetical protein